jgi:cation diffusion facilitator CzcD-associated flavoprotein CzcO
MAITCVIGAGGSGLAAAKVLLADGHDVRVFEREQDLGGVWAPWRAFPGLTTQTPGAQFEFSDFAFPAGLPAWPPAADVRAYLRAYAEHFGVAERIAFGTEVLRIDPHDDGGWTVTARRAGETLRESFDRVVVSSGIFDRPVLPAVPGREAFEQAGGRVLHSAQCTQPQLLERRRVVIVGMQKTATDLAVYAARHGSAVDVVYRRARWKLPRRFLRTVDIADTLYTRGFDALTRLATSVPDPTRRQRALQRAVGRPAALQFRALELVLRAQFGLRRVGLVPANGVEDEAHCGVTIETPGFYAAVHRGAVRTHRTVIERLEPGAALLAGGERVAADVVVYATGYSLDLPFLPADVAGEVFDADGCLRLYRNVLAPSLPTLGFVGFNSAIASPLAAELAAHWLAAHWGGRMTLPAPAAMNAHISAELRWRMQRWPQSTRALRNACVGLQHHYMDGLMCEMGLAPKIPGIRAALRAMRPADYAALLAPARPQSAAARRGAPVGASVPAAGSSVRISRMPGRG